MTRMCVCVGRICGVCGGGCFVEWEVVENTVFVFVLAVYRFLYTCIGMDGRCVMGEYLGV